MAMMDRADARELLHAVISEGSVELATKLFNLGVAGLTTDERLLVAEWLANELQRTGFDENWNISRRGLLIESLIDRWHTLRPSGEAEKRG